MSSMPRPSGTRRSGPRLSDEQRLALSVSLRGLMVPAAFAFSLIGVASATAPEQEMSYASCRREVA